MSVYLHAFVNDLDGGGVEWPRDYEFFARGDFVQSLLAARQDVSAGFGWLVRLGMCPADAAFALRQTLQLVVCVQSCVEYMRGSMPLDEWPWGFVALEHAGRHAVASELAPVRGVLVTDGARAVRRLGTLLDALECFRVDKFALRVFGPCRCDSRMRCVCHMRRSCYAQFSLRALQRIVGRRASDVLGVHWSGLRGVLDVCAVFREFEDQWLDAGRCADVLPRIAWHLCADAYERGCREAL